MSNSNGGAVAAGFSEACERNKQPILQVMRDVFANRSRVLEVGSGTGQHIVYFATQLPAVVWQPTDQQDYLPGLRARLTQEAPQNVLPALELDVRMQPWPVQSFDAVFSANTLHYMSETCGERFFAGVGEVLEPGGVLLVYGPFRYAGKFTSPSNARFDEWLRASDPARGVRDFEWLNELAAAAGMSFARDVAMPANNQCLVWGK